MGLEVNTSSGFVSGAPRVDVFPNLPRTPPFIQWLHPKQCWFFPNSSARPCSTKLPHSRDTEADLPPFWGQPFFGSISTVIFCLSGHGLRRSWAIFHIVFAYMTGLRALDMQHDMQHNKCCTSFWRPDPLPTVMFFRWQNTATVSVVLPLCCPASIVKIWPSFQWSCLSVAVLRFWCGIHPPSKYLEQSATSAWVCAYNTPTL